MVIFILQWTYGSVQGNPAVMQAHIPAGLGERNTRVEAGNTHIEA